jgi:hypothetical protein
MNHFSSITFGMNPRAMSHELNELNVVFRLMKAVCSGIGGISVPQLRTVAPLRPVSV